jgi:hypothetical protein
MGMPATAMMRVQFAFAFDHDFDPTELLTYLDRRVMALVGFHATNSVLYSSSE